MNARKLLAVALLTAPSLALPATPVAAEAASIARFGESLDAELELTPIAAILADPEAWAGKRVRVGGEVSGVCGRRGCWIDLVAEDDAALRVKVTDGVIVFPREAKGRRAVAEGEVEILEMERGAYEAWIRHVAEEEGRELDPDEIGQGPYRIVQLRGAGAEIEGL